jgi:cytoskeletal protein CcmA (bactofilin family)
LPLLALAGLLLSAALPAAAQNRSRPAAAGLAPERAQLRQTILALYEVLPTRGGLLLKPHASKVGVKTIELIDGSIAINGETTPPSVVRAWLVADAPPVLELAEVPPAERRQLFGLPAEGGTAASAATSATSATSATPATPATSAPKAAAATPKADSDDKSDDTAGDTPTPPEPPEAPEPPTPPTPPTTAVSIGQKVRVGGSVRIEANEIAETVVAVGGQVHVDGEVERDVAAIGGPAYINGKVGGGVTSVGGSVHLGPKADIGGDVTSVLGHIDADPEARIHGTKTEVTPGEVLSGRHGSRRGDRWDYRVEPFFGTASFFGTIFWIFLKLLLVCFTLLVARPRVERLERRLLAQPWESGGVGLLSLVAFVPALLLATALTCCLFLILYPVVFVIVFVVWLLGYTTVVYRIGRWSEERFGWGAGGSPYVAVLIGMGWIESLRIVGALLRIGDGFIGLFGTLLGWIGGVAVFCATILGIGVVLLDRFSGGWRRMPPPDGLPMSPVSPVSPVSPWGPWGP